MASCRKTLGILGGLGPMSGIHFCRLVTEYTKADRDQDHLDMILFSMASTPDRTEYILGKSPFSPLPVMKAAVQKLNDAGAQIIAVPCNTAHAFYPELCAASRVPVLNIAEETVRQAERKGAHRLGILATSGTVRFGYYQAVCKENGLFCLFPDEEDQTSLMKEIYETIKRGKTPDKEPFQRVIRHLSERGCDMIVFACTELSLLPDDLVSPCPILDSLHVLAIRSILACGGTATGFPDIYR